MLKGKVGQLQEMNSNLQMQLLNAMNKRSENADVVRKASPKVLKHLSARIVPKISDDVSIQYT